MRHRGVVVEWRENSFGFLQPASGGFKIFFHWRDIEASGDRFRRLDVGDVVEFEYDECNEHGLKAARVILIQRAAETEKAS